MAELRNAAPHRAYGRLALWLAGVVLGVVLGMLLARTLAERRSASAAPASVAAPTGAAASSSALELAPIDIATATSAELTQTLDVSGSLRAVQSAMVKARVAAEVRRLDMREGDRVAAGQLLGRLDATEAEWRLRQADDQARSAEAQLAIAVRTLDNNRALVAQGFISKNALETSVSSEAAARATVQAARAAAELARKTVSDTEIRAPIAGLVSQRLVQPGERVAVDARLLEIVDLSRIELEAAIAPADVLALRVGQPARISIDGLGERIGARVARINPSAASGTRTVMAYLDVEPHPALRQGLFARGSVELAARRALVVPASAVRHDQTRPYVLGVEDGRAVERQVSVGLQGDALFDGRRERATEITDGLAAGTLVLRGTVGSVRAGTALRLPAAAPAVAPAAAPAVAPSAAPGAAPGVLPGPVAGR